MSVHVDVIDEEEQQKDDRPKPRIGLRPSSPETHSMTGRVCGRKEGHFLRNYHHGPMSFHVLKHTTDEEGEHQHEGARLGELV